MRTYYIFCINNHFCTFYKENPHIIYDMLNQLYKLNKKDFMMGYRLFEQMCLPFNKNSLNEYIYNNHNKDISYQHINNNHIINNIYTNELSKLIVKNIYIKITTNLPYSILYNTLNRYNENLFICDFNNEDYFWLDKVSMETLV
ncbi:MAG: sporulation inhibitor of replication protein SirA [Bacilli bacterium]